MLANHELMEVDTVDESPSIMITDSGLLKTIEPVSVTPQKVNKKRRISDLKAATTEQEDESMEASAKSVKKLSLAPSTPTVNPTASIRNDIKRVLQSPNCELAKYYQIKSNNKLHLLQGQVGEAPYKNHPDTIKDLNEYFEDVRNVFFEDNFDFNSFLKTKYPSLIAKLAQDSQVPQSDLISSLRAVLIPVASDIPDFSLNSSILEGIMEKVSYGHPDAANNFTAWSCTFWQVKDLSLLGEMISRHFLTNYVLRQAARMILETSLESLKDEKHQIIELTGEGNNGNVTSAVTTDLSINLVEDLPMGLMRIESGTGTPRKKGGKEKQSVTVQSSTTQSTTAAATPTVIPQVKISSFFAKLKKPDVVERATGEYFQPFFVKPDVTLARLDSLKNLKIESGLRQVSEEDFMSAAAYWKTFRAQAVSIPYKKQTCLCVGYDGRPVRAVLKLLKFEENYRPAYFGTWRKIAPKGTVSARRPFGRVPEVDYEYESDAEWDEGEDPEGESLSDIDDDEEDADDEDEEINDGIDENVSCTESVDSWLVPHGYLSDDEGVDEVHPGELEEAAREAELHPPTIPTSNKRKEKRKFVPKEPMLLGPFFSDQVIPQILQCSAVQFADWAVIRGPFQDYDAVFAGLEASGSSKKNSESVASFSAEKSVFPEALLPSMIQIVNSNPSAGMTKLYDEFILQHGKAVSRRLFESKLNQITTGKLKCEKTGKLRWMFKEQYSPSASPMIID